MLNENLVSQKKEVAEPWLVDQRSFYPSENQDLLSENLAALKENHTMLTLITAQGKLYEEVLLISVEGDKIQIDRPLDWNENGDSFRIFYQDSNGHWCFFYSGEPATGPFSISLDIPGRMYYLQRRRFKRIPVPVGTRAMIKQKGNDLMKTVYLKDISEAGMLFCDGASLSEYPVDSFINDIVVSIPHPHQQETKADSGPRKLLPLIRKGKIVRTFVDQDTSRNYYGISFLHDSGYVKDTLGRMISEIVV